MEPLGYVLKATILIPDTLRAARLARKDTPAEKAPVLGLDLLALPNN